MAYLYDDDDLIVFTAGGYYPMSIDPAPRRYVIEGSRIGTHDFECIADL
jgi:hypothetical protein